MIVSLFLSHAHLRRDCSLKRLDQLLLPAQESARIIAASILVAALMSDNPKEKQDFLWREERPGVFFILSSRPPVGMSTIFDVNVKRFAPTLSTGDLVSFQLRANPTIARPHGSGKSFRRVDVIMDALHTVPAADRAKQRPTLIQSQGAAWLQRQGDRHGFTPEIKNLQIGRYRQLQNPRSNDPDSEISILEFEGVLVVNDPTAFLTAFTNGIGGKKTSGCGLLLMRTE